MFEVQWVRISLIGAGIQGHDCDIWEFCKKCKYPSNQNRAIDITQEADRPDRSTSKPKVVVGVPRVLKVFSWVLIYKFHKKIGLGPKKSVKTD